MTDADADRLVWIDCEMPGLDIEIDQLVEIAIVITDFDLTPVDPGFQLVIAPSATAWEHMNDVGTRMHRDSGLLDEIPAGVAVDRAEELALEYVRRFVPVARRAPLAGNTIGTDRMFLARQMPRLDAWLHYRNVDVSSIKELSRRWVPHAYHHAPVKAGGHRALADIRESIRELAYYRSAVFVATPGPSADQARQAAEQARQAAVGANGV
jgi:oligoribonuclease